LAALRVNPAIRGDLVMSQATQNPLGLSRIGQIALTVHDLDRAVAFYRDKLGMAFLFQFPGLAFFDCAGVRLMLSTPERPEFDHPGSIIYYKVDDLPTAYQTLCDRGVAFEDAPHLIATMPDHELWMAFFKDGEGNTLGLMSEVPRSAS
jgi:catechol 2,3-dioxygenase-like lactoylglutathione lyase family enzyme